MKQLVVSNVEHPWQRSAGALEFPLPVGLILIVFTSLGAVTKFLPSCSELIRNGHGLSTGVRRFKSCGPRQNASSSLANLSLKPAYGSDHL